jgi:hypothetical protein
MSSRSEARNIVRYLTPAREGDERPYRYWTREAAIAALRRLGERNGRVFTRSDIRTALDVPSEMTVIRMFGSIGEAQKVVFGISRPKHCPRRARCRNKGHPMVAGNLYLIRCADGTVKRRCRQCVLDYSKQRPDTRRANPRLRETHSPEALARHWGLQA